MSRSRCAADLVGIGSALLLTIMLDAENWKIVFEVYNGHPISGLVLAQQLYQVRESLQRRPKGRSEAIDAIDLAIESLY